MAGDKRVICEGRQLVDGGKGVRFTVAGSGKAVPAFAVRHGGRVYAYCNRCAHLGVELDWQPGEFFDDSGLYLVCATHGATYRPQDGRCTGGPCKGKQLEPIAVAESDGLVYLLE